MNRFEKRPRRIALVGNGPVTRDRSAQIDACEHVVRFNDAPDFGGRAGSRIDDLFLVNRGGAAAEWLDDADFAHRPVIAAAGRVVLPLNPGSSWLPLRRDERGEVHRDDRDHGERMRDALERAGRTVLMLDAAHHERCCEALGLVEHGRARALASVYVSDAAERAAHDAPRPSTGFIALLWYLAALPADRRIAMYSFTFEGWPGHPWRREREWVEARVAEGTVELVRDDP